MKLKRNYVGSDRVITTRRLAAGQRKIRYSSSVAIQADGSIVLAGSAFGMLLGGWLSDWISKRSADPVMSRRRLAVACYLAAAGCLYFGIRFDDPYALAALWGASFCAMHVTLPNWWSVAVPQSGRHIGALAGLMNGAGVIGAMASQWFVGAWSDYMGAAGFRGREQWDAMFDIYVAGLILAAGAWWSYRFRPLDDPPR